MAAVIHCASDPRRPADDPVAVGRLAEACREAGVGHLVHVGIAGIEPAVAKLPYYAAKLACEQHLAGSGLPHTVVRATQFHHFIAFLLERLDLRLAVAVPFGIRLQPVAVQYVASRLVYYARRPAAGQVPDVHGPERIGLDQLARVWLRTQGRRTPLLPLPVRPQPFAAFALLEPATGDGGGPTWSDWLRAQTAVTAASRGFR